MKKASALALPLTFLGLASCTHTQVAPAGVCGHANWPQVHCKVKCVVSGTVPPDSVSFNINMGDPSSGTYYFKKFFHPALPLADSVFFCGDLNSDINVRVWQHDTLQQYTCSIYVNDTLRGQNNVNVPAGCWGAGAQCR